MSKHDLEQKKALIGLMNNEPLMSARDFFRQTLEELGFANCKPSELTNSDYWLITTTAMESYSKYHLNNVKDVVCDLDICQNCGGDGYTIEVEATCCMRQGNECCGIPDPIQVQRECFCDKGIIPFDKQSITNAIENYIK